MPLYDYKCHFCGNVEEVLHSVADLNTYQFHCTKCGGTGGEKQISKPAIVYQSPDNSMFLGGNLTKLDTINGRRKKQKVISNQFRNTTPE